MRIAGRRRAGESFTVDSGTAELVRDTARRNAWTLFLDGVETSHVDLDDPTALEFEYIRWMADIIDGLAPAGDPLTVVHLGGGAATLARYVAATRSASRQVVFEIDGALVELVRERLPLPKAPGLRIRVGDARRGLLTMAAAGCDIVVRDVFAAGVAPGTVRTVEFASLVKETLRSSGVYLVNVADHAPFRELGRDLATLREVFPEIAVVSEPAVLRGRRRGNLVIAASATSLPDDDVARRVAGGAVQGRLRTGGEVRAMARGHRALHDDDVPAP